MGRLLICGNCGIELEKAVTLCFTGETRVHSFFFFSSPLDRERQASFFKIRVRTVLSEFALPATLWFGTAPNMHEQLGPVLVGGATFQWL